MTSLQILQQAGVSVLAQANLVGNIYYANYYEWQGQIRDRFLSELIPDYFVGIGEKGELLALESRVDHLREAMPFDRILLTLAVKELRTRCGWRKVNAVLPGGARRAASRCLRAPAWPDRW